jgi:Mg-chelatase subunit ChlD
VRRFRPDNNKGGVAILFALAILPVFGLMGAAIDYGWASLERTRMQRALDSTALALAKMMPASQGTLDLRGRQFFDANMGQSKLVGTQLTIVAVAGKIDLQASGVYKTQLFNVLGVYEIDLGARSEARWGQKKLEVALALDNTGSMAWSGKMTELKKAVRDLLDKLKAAAQTPDSVRVAIVPFDTTVRVDYTGWTAPSWVKFDSQWEKQGWTGCLEDRDQPYDVQDTAPSGSITNYPATSCNYPSALGKMRPLTNDWDALRATVDDMDPNGNTNVTIGLVWAWHALTSSPVLTEAKAASDELEKAIIVLTDGENTENRWTTSRWSIDARTRTACANIKAAKITVYSIRVIEGNATLLRQCATDDSHYFEVQDAAQLSGVFSAIGDKLVNLHLSK